MAYLSLCLILVSLCTTFGGIVLTNNGYEGLQIVIAEKIEEDATLIQKIKEHFTDASAYLFQVTNNRTYFRQIDIIVPQSWTSISHNSTTASVDTSSEYYLIDEPHSTFNHSPYTRGNLVCGESSWYTHLTPGFLTSTDNAYGPPGRVIVHEWGHLRWGLFDEYPSIRVRNTQNYIHFYQHNGLNQPVKCSRDIQGTTIKDGIANHPDCNLNKLPMDPDCKFIPYTDQTARASVMSHQWIPSVTGFCDRDSENDASIAGDLRHNSDAVNLQNRLCDDKSSWEVLREHEDFINGNSPPDPTITDTTPVFNIVRKSAKTRVMVFDVSGSMGLPSSRGIVKILEQATAADFVIDNVIDTGTDLALVKFTLSATTLIGMTEINSEQSKQTLKSHVPRSAGGGTNIYWGLRQAMQELENNGPTVGTEIILLSDGISYPYLHILPDITSRGIIVHTIAITNAADPNMTTLASQTGGKSFTYLETSQISFADVLSQALRNTDAGETTSEQVLSNTYEVTSNNNQVVGSFIIDDGLGNDTSVAVLLPSSQTVTMEITGPDGTVYSVTESGNTVSLAVNSNQQIPAGEYTFTITLPTFFSGTAEVHASSSPVSVDAEVVHVTGRLSNTTITYGRDPVIVYIFVGKGKAAIMNVNVTLILAADSTFTPLPLRLLDNGAGADPIADDGVYSVYLMYTYFTANSNYNIKIHASGDGTAYYYTNGDSVSRAAAVSGSDDSGATTQTVDAFERTLVMEEITVENFQTIVVDTIAPAKITDLRIEKTIMDTRTNPNTMTFEFVWTAPGSDLDVGQATSYEMRYGTNRTTLRNDFFQQQLVPATLPAPQISGSTETLNITFSFSDCNGTCYVTILATDENNLAGSVSNIVAIDVDFTYTTELVTEVTTDTTTQSTTPTTTSEAETTSSSTTSIMTSTNSNTSANKVDFGIVEKAGNNKTLITLMVPISIAVLALLLVLLYIAYRYYKSKDEVQDINMENIDPEVPEPELPTNIYSHHQWGPINNIGRKVVDVYPFFSGQKDEKCIIPGASEC